MREMAFFIGLLLVRYCSYFTVYFYNLPIGSGRGWAGVGIPFDYINPAPMPERGRHKTMQIHNQTIIKPEQYLVPYQLSYILEKSTADLKKKWCNKL